MKDRLSGQNFQGFGAKMTQISMEYKMKKIFSGLILAYSAVGLASYEKQFPQYFEYCTGTQLKYQKEYFDGAQGGPGGHGFMYIHGLCKDMDQTYPQVKPCDRKSTHQGVGISLDSDYTNVAWVAVPGRDLMLLGESSRKAIGKREIEHVLNKSIEHKIFQNVKMKQDAVTREGFGTVAHERAAALFSIGTDIAVAWARDLRCVKIPVTKKAIASAANYLNQVNDSYYKGNKSYKWSMVSNNCTHLAMNTSAAMGMNPSIEVDRALPVQLFNLAVPANAYMMYADKILNERVSAKKILRSEVFQQFGYYPVQVGSLLVREAVFPTSEMFKNDELRGISLPRKKLLKMFTTLKRYDRQLTPQNTELKANSESWIERYSKMRGQQKVSAEDSYVEVQLERAQKLAK
jgi:hypothetical protein